MNENASDVLSESGGNPSAENSKTMDIPEWFEKMKSSAEGLSAAEAENRLAEYGPNALEETHVSLFRVMLSYFWGPIPWMIEIAAVLSMLLKHWDDVAIIMALLIYNAAIGFWQERKASNALDALKKGLALKARVLRDGAWISAAAAELVPGDVVRLALGEVVPADVVLTEGSYISIDQAALTGESLPVNKKVGDSAYSSSIVKQGEMTALVTATGGSTFFGRTAKLVSEAGAASHSQKAVLQIGNFLIIVAGILSFILVGFELYRDIVVQEAWKWNDVINILQFVLILVIASIPVAMPAVLSITTALGALALSREKAIVSRLSAIEEMAGVDILCSDKTGTLTKNQLTLGDPVVFGQKDAQACILGGALASRKDNADAIDAAVIGGLADPSVLRPYTQTEFIPFDPVGKRTEATLRDADGNILKYTKGAPQVIIDMCRPEEEIRQKAEQSVARLAAKGFRALGVAESRDSGSSWTFLGLLSLFDPPRDDSRETIEKAHDHGVDVKMVTGDDVAIGSEIAGQLGMGTRIRPASELFREGMEFSHLPPMIAESIEKADGFARVFPEHKYGIVKALQDRGHIVAMTGDGVNDAPALKQADCGIAVSGATDAARSAAALILTAPGLSVIINAIETARQIFERIMSYTIYRIAMTVDIMFVVVLATIIFNFRPLTALMIVVLALLDDIPIMTIAYDNTRIDEKPVRWRMDRVLSISTTMGLLAVVQSFGLLIIGMEWMSNPALQAYIPIDRPHLQTLVFLQLVAGGHLMLFVTRTRGFFLKPPLPSMPLFLAIVGTQIFAVLMCGMGWMVPAIDWRLIGFAWAYMIVWIFLLDLAKLFIYHVIENRAGHQQKFLRFMNR